MRRISDAAVLEDLVSRFRRLAPAQRCVWGTMNAQQMARHVGDASSAVLKQRPFSSKPRGGAAPTIRRILLLYVLPRMPRGIKAGANPAGAVVDPEAFGVDVERAVSSLHQLAGAQPGALAERHPILGTMSRSQWMRWAFMHTDHHLRQFGL